MPILWSKFGINLLYTGWKLIEYEIISQMLNDRIKCEPFEVKAIPGFDINTVSYEMMGPVFDNDFGVVFLFTIMGITSF